MPHAIESWLGGGESDTLLRCDNLINIECISIDTILIQTSGVPKAYESKIECRTKVFGTYIQYGTTVDGVKKEFVR